jgi:uncharacterized damage-inducible protein DinB
MARHGLPSATIATDESRQEGPMLVSDLLLPEFDEEMQKTRTTLERVPDGKAEFAPHPRSMPLGKLAPHVAQLAGFGLTILTTPELDFSQGSHKPLAFESAAQLVRAFDEGAVKARGALAALPDSAWTESWKLSFQGKPIFSGSRFLAYRQMFINHLVHHRAQLGVYLRLNGVPVPSTYGPSADETLGF